MSPNFNRSVRPATISVRTIKGRWKMLSFNSPSLGKRFSLLAWVSVLALIFSSAAFGQTTISTGSIVGTVTDPQGAVVAGARITITDVATGQSFTVTSNNAGAFNSGALVPGSYKTQASATGFSTVSQVINVQVGNTASFNPKLQVGQESQVN